MEFTDIDHQERYRELLKKAQVKESEADWRAALFLLSSPLLAGKGAARYVQPRKIELSDLMKAAGPWSSSEKALLRLAAALFNSSWKADINDVFWSLDHDNVNLALEALKIRFA